MAELPSGETVARRLLGKAAFYDLVLAPLAIVGVEVAGYDHWTAGQHGRGGLLVAAGVAVSALGVVKAQVSYRDQRQDRRRHEPEGCLHTLHAVVMGDASPAEVSRPDLRVTIHKLVDNGQRFAQVTDYVGVPIPQRSRVGRRFPAQSGVIGRALQLHQAVVVDRVGDDLPTLREQLMTALAYTREDVDRVNASP